MVVFKPKRAVIGSKSNQYILATYSSLSFRILARLIESGIVKNIFERRYSSHKAVSWGSFLKIALLCLFVYQNSAKSYENRFFDLCNLIDQKSSLNLKQHSTVSSIELINIVPNSQQTSNCNCYSKKSTIFILTHISWQYCKEPI